MNAFIAKARETRSAEELLALAKENEMEDITEETAVAYFQHLHKTGELSDEELDNVAGGGCHAGDGRLIVTTLNSCSYWTCEKCGTKLIRGRKCGCHWDPLNFCGCCQYCSYEKGMWYCNHPKKRKK